MVTEKKWNALKLEMEQNGVLEADIDEKFVLVGGKGGQKANKSAVAVQLKYVPKNIVVKSGKTRSREDNRFFARRALLEQILDSKGTNVKKNSAIDKKRKAKARKKAKSKKKYSGTAASDSGNSEG